MSRLNKQAVELNKAIQKTNPVIFDLFSEKGRAIYFPKEGIVNQSADAKGKRINATIGIATEDDGMPMRLTSISQYLGLNPNDVFPYAPSPGKPELRKAWQAMIKSKNPSLNEKISLPVVTNAITHGLSVTGYLFVNPGDKIIIPDKYWENYELIFENGFGGELLFFNTFREEHFDVESLKKRLSGRGKKQIVLLSFPNNPTGYTPTEEEAEKITQIILKSAVRGNKIVVILDDAYFGLVYEPGVYTESLFSKLAGLHENVLAVKLDGATKEDYVWGLRVGFITYSSRGISDQTLNSLEAKTSGAVRGSISNASHLSQSLILSAIISPVYEQEKREKFNLLKTRYQRVQEVLNKNRNKFARYFSPLPFNSGYFMCIELKNGVPAEQVRRKLLSDYNTGVISIGNLLRIAFSSVQLKDIPETFENIFLACRDVSDQSL